VAKAWALGFGVLAIAYFAVRPSPSRGALPDDPRALAARVAAHPADWLAASALAEKALDMRVRDPRELWRVSGALASSLAPLLPEPRASLARGAFFHWSELTAGDRRWVLDAYAPLLRQVTTFETMELPLFSLTGDLAYLRRVGPPGLSTTLGLAQIAAINGLFADYRALRAELPPQPRGNPIDSRQIAAKEEVAIVVAAVESDDVPPYVEIWVDGVLRDEGVVNLQRKFTVRLIGKHTLAIWLINPLTRNRLPRRARVVSVQAL